jgi:acyl dehydratase
VAVSYDDVEVGTEIAAQTYGVSRGQLVQYAGASGDFNIIHWNERFAKAVGLPDVIAHGMFTMATAARLVTDWVGDPAAVLEYGVRFSSMVPVPDDDGATSGNTLIVSGTVEEKLEGKRVSVGLTARSGGVDGADGAKVLTQARAIVQLS